MMFVAQWGHVELTFHSANTKHQARRLYGDATTTKYVQNTAHATGCRLVSESFRSPRYPFSFFKLRKRTR